MATRTWMTAPQRPGAPSPEFAACGQSSCIHPSGALFEGLMIDEPLSFFSNHSYQDFRRHL